MTDRDEHVPEKPEHGGGWPDESWPNRSLLDPMGEVQGWRRVSAAANSEEESVRRPARRFGLFALIVLFAVPLLLIAIEFASRLL